MLADESLNIYEYEQILLGKETRFKVSFGAKEKTRKKKSGEPEPEAEDAAEYKDSPTVRAVMTQQARNQTIGNLWKYAVLKLLKWTPEQAAKYMTDDIAKMLCLDSTLESNNIKNSALYQTDFRHVLSLAFPDDVHMNDRETAIDVYKHKARLDQYANEISPFNYPKKFFIGTIGRQRTAWILQYVVSRYIGGESIADQYRMFAEPSVSKWLRRHCIDRAMEMQYDCPLDYFHYSLPEYKQDNLLYYALKVKKIVDGEIGQAQKEETVKRSRKKTKGETA